MATTPARSSPRREAILGELVDLFCAHGFAQVGINDLASILRCSKSTLYDVAPSKEQLITAAVREFFRRATERIEAALVREADPAAAVGTYLTAISVELATGSPQFFVDLDRFPPAREIYTRNTRVAARRVRDLVGEGSAGRPGVDARFLGVVAGQVMESINSGRASAETGLDHAASYRALADLITAGARVES
jgi:AcrR family transcriptional regulator